jgi:3-deoxy-D-manno-octulosonate 8-phosphate phosphatase (KDO 8-P phosphatase)
MSAIRLVAFDIDGTLTNGRTWFAGEEIGWAQEYSIRDGEAMLRLARRGYKLVPISRNRTPTARRRMEWLGLDCRWLGVDDKIAALEQVCAQHAVERAAVCFVGDGFDDAPLIAAVGLGLAVADAHHAARKAAARVTRAAGGQHVFEEVENILLGDE